MKVTICFIGTPILTHTTHMAMCQNPGFGPVNIPIPTKIGSKIGVEFTHPKLLLLVLTHSHIFIVV